MSRADTKKIVLILTMLLIITSTMNVIGQITNNSYEEVIIKDDIENNLDTMQIINNDDLEIYKQEIVNECGICGEENLGYPVMTDMPPESERPMNKMISTPKATIDRDDLPSQFSWKDYNGDWTTPVKDQAYPVYCGSCYIFGTWAAFEAAINIASGYPTTDIDLSEQYGLSCINAGCNGCGGGWGSTMIENIVSTATGSSGNGINGVPLESCMPYTATDYIPCDDKCPDWDYHTDPILDPDDILWQIADWGWTSAFNYNNPNDWVTIKSWLMTYGPLAVTMAWDNGIQNFVDTYHNPTDVYQVDSSGSTNHIILLCGWVDDDSILNGGYWILKNSHGTVQGYGGFCNLAYGCNRLASSECSWIIAEEWPEEEQGEGPVNPVEAVFSNFDYNTEDGAKCPHPDEIIDFQDESRGPVVLWNWDFDGDGEWDISGMGHHQQNPEWTYDSEGTYQVTLEVWGSGGLSNRLTKTVQVKDIWPPVAVSKPDYYGGKDNEIYFDGRYSYDPDGSITSYIWDFNGDGTIDSTQPYYTYTYPDQNGEYEATLTVYDQEGASNTVTIPVKIDKTVPPVTKVIAGCVDQAQDLWFNSKVMVELQSTDWSGLSRFNYKIDNGDWQQKYCQGELDYSFSFYIKTPGVHNIQYYAKDIIGNIESTKTSSIGIDVNNPTMNCVLKGDKNTEGVYITPVEITINANDAESGVKTITYKIDTGDWIEYTAPFTINQGGSHIVNIFVIDKAGNTVNDAFTVKLEYGPSIPKISGPSSGKPNNEYTFSFTSYDPENNQVAYYVDWGDGTNTGWSSYVNSGKTLSYKHTWTEEKSYTIKAKAKDSNGAESDWATQTISLPKTKYFMFQRFLNNFPVLQKLLSLAFFQKLIKI
ncbi:MAG: hypothetical protein BV456_08385 [Thermoplasmata archaeon M8B2D]|nr:MAG: hypothetical protein BV456_08385 [Thermoplasmata archaeon M8B2D]